MPPLHRGLTLLFAAILVAVAGCDGQDAAEPPPKVVGQAESTKPTSPVEPTKSVPPKAAEPSADSHPPGAERVRGIDISNWQGDVAWEAVKGAGIGFAYLQATQGLNFIDPNFDENVKGIRAAGLPYGAYHFFRPNDDAEKQAELFLRITKGKLGALPPMLDVEITAGLPAEKIGAGAKRWLEIVENAVGCTPLVYSYGSFWEKNLRVAVGDYPLWMAEYAAKPRLPAGKERWTLWQYSQKGRVAGVNGPVDLDWFNGDAQALERFRCVKEG